MRMVGLALVLAATSAHANGRPPLTNGIHFKPGDPHSMYVATTFGLLVSHDDGCTMSWICETNLGYGGEWDPKYAIASDGTIFATTFTGLRISRDGGCSFTTATAELPSGDPSRIADEWIDALALGPTGDVWVGTAESGKPNDVFVSHDNGMTFQSRGMLSPTIYWKSVRVAPSNMMRVYISGYELTPPTPHLLHTDNGGTTWTPSPLTNITYGSTPLALIAAVDPINPDIVYVVSQGANAPAGDKLYRSIDAGQTYSEVLASPNPIHDVVIQDAQHVFVTTLMQSGMTFIGGPVLQSIDGGATFDAMANEPQLACLGISPDGTMVGCGANWMPDYEAVARSQDGATTWKKIWRFVEIAGPLACPAGTAEHDTCDQAQWESVRTQFGATGPSCGVNVVTDQAGDPVPKPKGCCDTSGGSSSVLWAGAFAMFLRRKRQPSRQLG